MQAGQQTHFDKADTGLSVSQPPQTKLAHHSTTSRSTKLRRPGSAPRRDLYRFDIVIVPRLSNQPDVEAAAAGAIFEWPLAQVWPARGP